MSRLRQARYVGLAKAKLQFIFTAAAMNLERVSAHLAHGPLLRSNVSRLAALAPAS
jgi:hypothetical protein